jgi:Ca-activated chloride channel homolog
VFWYLRENPLAKIQRSFIQMKQFLWLFVLVPTWLCAQTVDTRQKALSATVDYANSSAEEITRVVSSIIEMNEKKSWTVRNYICPVQQDPYHYPNVTAKLKGIPGLAFVLTKVDELKKAADYIDQQCKKLDTYHKLEDYKRDNFETGNKIVDEIITLIQEYKKRQAALSFQLEGIKNPSSLATYKDIDQRMLQRIKDECKLLDDLAFNLKFEIHTGWVTEKIQQSILSTDLWLAEMKKLNPPLKYPASSMWPNFLEGVQSILDMKRNALDSYNNEAKKSDRHTNNFYFDLINYVNGVLVADYNTFLQFSQRDGYSGIGTIKYVPTIEIRTGAQQSSVGVDAFKDITRIPPKIVPQKTAISKSSFQALSNYVNFINESWRQTEYMRQILTNFNSTAAYYKTLPSYDRRGPIHFDFKDFQVPQSYYLKAIADSKSLSPDIAKSLNDQTEVIFSILREMNERAANIESEVKSKKYEQDHLDNIYKILERQSQLLAIWDDRKEILYNDVRAVYQSYPSANKNSSWQISGNVLRELMDLNHDALFKAKAFYRGDSTIKINTDEIDQTLRNVIAKEYENMKGIQKFGRSNGLCPYTPYEDIPEHSRTGLEYYQKLKPANGKTGYQHPYHSMVYIYNAIVDDLNKFSELSTTVLILPAIKQPELLSVKYPDRKVEEPVKALIQNQTGLQPQTQTSDEKKKIIQTPTIPVSDTKIQTVKEIHHDTVYIEKRDTVYLAEPSEELLSMEGYATNNLVLLLDVSGSMNTPEKLPVLKTSVLDMISMMRPEDKISIITFSGKPKVVLSSVSFKDEEKIKKAINDLLSSGKTDGNAGIKLAYKTADENYIRGGNNRIVLATDGEFPVSNEIKTQIEKFSTQDIFLSIFNFGKSPHAIETLGRLAELGKGNYVAISKENLQLKLIKEAKSKRKK